MNKIINNFKTYIVATILVFGFALVALPAHGAAAGTASKSAACEAIGGTGGSNCSAGGADIDGLVGTIIDIISVVVGIMAVIMIIVAGAKFITSCGDANKVSSAKNSLLYAIIGIAIVALAQVIVRFVLQKTT